MNATHPLLQPDSSGNNRLGKYRLIAELGRGGMATVFLAVASEGIQDVRKLVVIKLINEQLLQDPEFVKLFAREAKIAAELAHPNVVVTHTVGQESGRYYIVMEYLEGVTLRDVMARSGEWPLQDRLPLLGAMCLALTGLGYVHEGQVKLLDFGVAKANGGEFEATLGMPIRGTLQYMAPEGVKPGAVVDHRADVFSAGVILAEIATGQRYWAGQVHTQIITRLAADDLPPVVTDGGEQIPPALARIIERALHPDPEQRFDTVHDLRRAIQPFLSKQGYRVDASALARIVGHLYEPTRGRREAAIRACLDELDAAGGVVRTAAESQGDATLSVASETDPGSAPVLEVGSAEAPSSPPAPRRWGAYAAVFLALLLVPLSWTFVKGCGADVVVDDSPRPIAAAQSEVNTRPEVPARAEPETPAPTASEAPPIEVAPVVPEPATRSDATTADVPTPASSPATAAGVAKSPKSKPKNRKPAKDPSSSDTSSTVAPAPESPAKPATKSAIEPSPYTR
jgi:serine/threonine-protein kinase